MPAAPSSLPARRVLLEIAVDSADDAVLAEQAGANRIELCAALELHGLTPSLGTLRDTVRRATVPVVMLIRPRGGGFCYDAGDLASMMLDIDAGREAGAAAFAFGVLRDDLTIDATACAALVARCTDRPAVFHRAFDLTPDPLAALDQLIDLGFTRVLTSGRCESAATPRAMELIAKLAERAAGRIEILPGGGVRAETAAELVRVTGCTQVHAACRTAASTRPDEAFERLFTAPVTTGRLDAAHVAALRGALDNAGNAFDRVG